VAILALDLDRFKDVNDTFGHQFGDELLREVAKRLSGICRATDTVARLGGDEFAIVQVQATGQSAAALSDRIVKALSQPFDLSVGRVFVGSSVGIALLDKPGADPIDGMRQADLALYRAKGAGGGQYAFFKQEMDAALRMRRAVEADLREALASGGLSMAYQTQVDGEGRVVAVEALARWDHPVRGKLAPEFFVGVAEECGLIEPLSIFTLRTAFVDARRWPNGVKVAINISPAHLRMRSFLHTIRELVAETGADPHRFELEITESLFLGDDTHVMATLAKLREMGFALALDDFGTGYSSLSYLRKYPVDKIKIDQSFVAGLGADADADAMVTAIIRLAGALNLNVVAEGVETEDQLRRLRAAGCPDIQGFLYSHPMRAAEVDHLVSAPPRPQVA
jgi:diguanylate cyclase (GGDEF)-like protein